MIDSENKRLREIGVNVAVALGDAFDETGLIKELISDVWAATVSIVDHFI